MSTNPETKSILDAGAHPNEDRLTVLDQAAWVIDGTSGFSDRSITSHPDSDGVWFVEEMQKYLTEHVYDDESLENIVAGAIEHVALALDDEITAELEIETAPPDIDGVSMSEIPAATIGLVRWTGGELEYYSLGDSSVLLRTGSGVEHYIEAEIQKSDAYLKSLVREKVDEDTPTNSKEILSDLQPRIRETRQYREVPGGFWCLGINPVSARKAISGTVSLEDLRDIYLFSDGFLDVVDGFDLFEDWESVADYIDAEGVDAAVSKLREIQADDDSLVEYPRLKKMDDIAMIHLDFAPDKK